MYNFLLAKAFSQSPQHRHQEHVQDLPFNKVERTHSSLTGHPVTGSFSVYRQIMEFPGGRHSEILPTLDSVRFPGNPAFAVSWHICV